MPVRLHAATMARVTFGPFAGTAPDFARASPWSFRSGPTCSRSRGGVCVREQGLRRDADARGETRVVVDLLVSVAHAPKTRPERRSDVGILLLYARRFVLSSGANLSTSKHWPQMTIGTWGGLGVRWGHVQAHESIAQATRDAEKRGSLSGHGRPRHLDNSRAEGSESRGPDSSRGHSRLPGAESRRDCSR